MLPQKSVFYELLIANKMTTNESFEEGIRIARQIAEGMNIYEQTVKMQERMFDNYEKIIASKDRIIEILEKEIALYKQKQQDERI